MKSVNEMIEDILRREGGFVDHPADRGGPTRYGITQNTLSSYLGRAAQYEEVRNLDREVARQIYARDYYYQPQIDQLPEEIQPFVFDCAVNHGPGRAIKFVQAACNRTGYTPLLVVDGAMGPNTRAGAEWAQAQLGAAFMRALLEERRDFYRQIVDRDPSQDVFLAGWMNRVREFEEEIA
ncbi:MULTISPECIES: glycoside hydrolase family 108 protein [Microbulbifer]|uniref:glycoside hydrolase family 108 protein n=1 Tax=Microbulbifer TaxID=48073 RepID=UPI001E40E2D3|nr:MULTISPECIES: N-acetylmuramidase [Microbulbifer]UHQ55422.1 N-acetylmuramidase [Microbulbifer sp. YPW16]